MSGGPPGSVCIVQRGIGYVADVVMLPGWWFKPEYIINELNINAAITSPAHDEVVALRPQPYTVRGYAYTGAPGTGVAAFACQRNVTCLMPCGSWHADSACHIL